ncbi:hypothetical protein NDU88_007074 [Pleurodeles waltl]|uniref:Uncharacterized protein n=1 Tax=Pleurodeles waltl TaxID=8319 RepID=A0AAV7UNU6_PLEWA|nr:hypothetical protein NDU88_007074 [Pleurodeles waltl]
MASFEDDRDKLAAELFSTNTSKVQVTNQGSEGLKQTFIKVERLKKQELSKWRDATILKRYLELKQIPRGLRITIFPSFDHLDSDLLGEWEGLILLSSFGMMNILIKHAETRREVLLIDIAKLEQEIVALNPPKASEKNYKILKNILTDYQFYIKDKKFKKLKRDEADYRNGRVFTFACKYDDIKILRHSQSDLRAGTLHNISASTTNVSSISSGSSETLDNSSGTFNNTTRSKPTSFLEELARFKRGQRLKHSKSGAKKREVDEAGRASTENPGERMTTRSVTRNQKN